jgi:hypothetical protein
LTVFWGSIILAELVLSIRVDNGYRPALRSAEIEPVRARRFRQIFAAYSHQDRVIVDQVEELGVALGDRYLRDCRDLRAGEIWNDRVQELISEADIFQLFWSWAAMRSKYVRQEWEYALSLGRADFVRPTYWEEPLPSDSAQDLPPECLHRLHFQRIYVYGHGDDDQPPPDDGGNDEPPGTDQPRSGIALESAISARPPDILHARGKPLPEDDATSGTELSPAIPLSRSGPSDIKPVRDHRRLWRVVAVAALASSILVLVAAGDRLFFRGFGNDRPVVLACAASSAWSEMRGGDKEWQIRVSSPVDGFLTVVALAPGRKPRVQPVYGGDDLPVRQGTSESVALPGGSTAAVYVVTETPAAEPIDRFITGAKRYQPGDADELRTRLQEWLFGKGYHRMAIGQALPPKP